MKYFIFALLFLPFFVQAQDKKAEHDFELELEGEYRYFFSDGQFDHQDKHYPSLALRPKYSVTWNEGEDAFHFKGFFRWDKDIKRTHGDIRELYYQKAKNQWELSVGIKKIYWGVTESNHLVDIINTTDLVESFDGEKKFGQPMVHFSYMTNHIGTFDFFYLPYFRKQIFPGEKARLRYSIIIEDDAIPFESSQETAHQDFAVRWSNSISIFDIGLSYFKGTGREPFFNSDGEGNLVVIYPINSQTGLDVQATTGPVLWKVETIMRNNTFQEMRAFTGGLEYTLGNVGNSGMDIGLLAEYSYDNRGDWALNALQDDLFAGGRFAFNDINSSEVLIGAMMDLEKSSKIYSIEASRRIKNSLKIELEGRFFSNIDPKELILSNFKEDSFLRFTVFKYF